jgi:EAL domain-containing protein (putative c-di-GMP-specific phosphodiesterase class I)
VAERQFAAQLVMRLCCSLAVKVIKALAEAQIAPGRLEIEITESVMLEHNAAAMATLTQLHALGVRIARDDFGTGYSSLSNLRRFPFD